VTPWLVGFGAVLVIATVWAAVAKWDREHAGDDKYANAERRKRAMREANR